MFGFLVGRIITVSNSLLKRVLEKVAESASFSNVKMYPDPSLERSTNLIRLCLGWLERSLESRDRLQGGPVRLVVSRKSLDLRCGGGLCDRFPEAELRRGFIISLLGSGQVV